METQIKNDMEGFKESVEFLKDRTIKVEEEGRFYASKLEEY